MQTLKLENHVQVRLEMVIMYYGNNLKIYKMPCQFEEEPKPFPRLLTFSLLACCQKATRECGVYTRRHHVTFFGSLCLSVGYAKKWIQQRRVLP